MQSSVRQEGKAAGESRATKEPWTSVSRTLLITLEK